jgi:hypothetical protein
MSPAGCVQHRYGTADPMLTKGETCPQQKSPVPKAFRVIAMALAVPHEVEISTA